MSLHGARTPGQGHAGFDRRISSRSPWAKRRNTPSDWRRALQPGIELCPLALADERDKVFRQGAGVREFARLGAPLGELLGLDGRALVCASHHSHAARRAVSGGCLASLTASKRLPMRR